MDTEKFLAGLEQLKFGIFDTPEWNDICKRENQIGPEAVLEEILDKRLWTNAEIMWVVRRLLFYYGSRDKVLQKVRWKDLLNTANPPGALLAHRLHLPRTWMIIFALYLQ